MKKIVLYGTGTICRRVIPALLSPHTHLTEGYALSAVINPEEKLGKSFWGIPLITLDQYVEEYRDHGLVIAEKAENIPAVKEELEQRGITDYTVYDELVNLKFFDRRERVISYTWHTQLEDVILYHVFHDFDMVFYIDVGSNDPNIGSVTKLLYDAKNAHGINIDPMQELIDLCSCERPRDISICAGLGEAEGTLNLFVQGRGDHTFLETNISEGLYHGDKRSVPITTLEKICDKYIAPDQQINFLKIDVEGYERNVLLGANFQKYRPMVINMEATLPRTTIPCYDKWEDILVKNRYHYVFDYGVNRYYVADEHSELDKRFVPIIELMSLYDIYFTRQV